MWAVLAEPGALARVVARPRGGGADRAARASRPARTGSSRARTARASCRRPQLGGSLLILEVVPLTHVAFQLTSEHAEVELDLEPVEDGETQATLAVEAPRFGGMGRTVPSQALAGLADARPAGRRGLGTSRSGCYPEIP